MSSSFSQSARSIESRCVVIKKIETTSIEYEWTKHLVWKIYFRVKTLEEKWNTENLGNVQKH